MRLVNSQKLCDLQKKPSNIRNICIMAHVDHGKTTLADSLVASNGIISPRMAGKLRYLDSRQDEQERGITMKSSSIALYYNTSNAEYLVNLIDSPGHVDFSSEVSTAVRLCDGAVILVDVVEGVCPQTQVALKHAWLENIRPVLVLNKMDRLIVELKLSALDAYVHLTQVLERVNAIMGELFATHVLSRCDENQPPQHTSAPATSAPALYDWSDGLEEADDSHLYFSPDQGNVIFASAADGWGFSIEDFAKQYSARLGVNAAVLRRTLWGDFYLHGKSRRVMRGAQEKAKRPMFVQFVLDNIWALYETIVVRKDKEKLLKIVESLNVKVTARDLRHTDPKVLLQAVCSQWLPLATAVLEMVCAKLPGANELSETRVEQLMCHKTQGLESLPAETQALKTAFLQCSSDAAAPVIVFVSKMFPVEQKSLPKNKVVKVLSSAEIAERREQALRRALKALETKIVEGDTGSGAGNEELAAAEEPVHVESEDVFIAFARVFSGCLRKGQEVYVLGPKHDPAIALDRLSRGETIEAGLTLKDLKSGHHVTRVMVDELYLMMGRELEALEEVPAGNVLGIGGLSDHVLKSATLSTQLACPAFSELRLMAVPILRVAVEPTRPADMPALVRGLRLLNQADACVQVLVQETGEHVLVTAGEVHLERCLDDLRQRYAKVPVNASEPIVPFRETIVPPPTVDMVNEAIQEQHSAPKKEIEDPSLSDDGTVTVCTSNRQSTIVLRAAPLPSEVTAILENNTELIRALNRARKLEQTNEFRQMNADACVIAVGELNEGLRQTELGDADRIADRTRKAIDKLRSELSGAFERAASFESEGGGGGESWSADCIDQIWSFGPRHCGPNLLINRIPGHEGRNVWSEAGSAGPTVPSLLELKSSFVNGFQLASLAGPLCEEPMMGVAFLVLQWTVETDAGANLSSAPFGPLSGQIMSAVKDGCRRAFQARPQRLMVAMYSCSIQLNTEALGKMYGVLGRRGGRILHGDLTQGSASFTVSAVLPVIESYNLAAELRKQTSGLANPQLVFSHWEVLDVDPFWSPSTEEEYLHYGEKGDSGNRARRYMDSVRRRKGLAVEEKLVEFAEKQRTLSKNK